MHIPDHITEDFIIHYASVTHRRKKQAALLTSAELEKKEKINHSIFQTTEYMQRSKLKATQIQHK